MTLRIDHEWSTPLSVHGGVPQGSILGVFLFNVTTDDIEDGCGADTLRGPSERPGMPPLPPDSDVSSSSDSEGTWNPPSTSSPSQPDLPPDAVTLDMSVWGPGLVFPHLGSPPSPVQLPDFDFLPGERNSFRAGWRPPVPTPVPPEPNPWTSAKWKVVPPLCLKYIDDGVTLDHLNYETVPLVGNEKNKHAIRTQNVFKHTVSRACLLYTSPSPRD